MDKLIEYAPNIIEKAGDNPLALVALASIVVGVIAFVFFRDAGEFTRVIAFALMGVGLLFFLALALAPPLPQPTFVSPAQPSPAQASQAYQVQMATLCRTTYGGCPLLPGLARGAACVCVTPYGQYDPGVAE